MKMKLIVRLLLYIVALGVVGFLVWLGISYKDSFYYILASLILLFSLGTLIRKEKLPQLAMPKVDLNFKDKKAWKNIKSFKMSSLTKSLSGLRLLKGKELLLLVQFIILTVILTLVIVYWLPSVPEKSFISSFIKSSMMFATKKNVFVVALTIAIFAYNLFVNIKFVKKVFIKKLLNSLFSTFVFLTITIFTSLALTFLSILLFGNSLIIASGVAPNLLGIHTDKNDIRQNIDKNDENFILVGITQTPAKTFIINYPYLGKKGGYFTNNFLTTYPNFLLVGSSTINRSAYLIKNTIVIKELDKDIFQTFAPTLIKKLVKKDLSPRYIKDEPDVQIISRQDYLKYREDQINKEVEEIAGYIAEAKKVLGSIGYNIQVAKNNISTLQGYIALNTQYRDEEWNNCITATYTYYGWYSNYTYRRYSDAYCQSQRAQRDQKNAEYQSEITTNQKNLSYYQSQYNELKGYLDQFQNYKAFIESTKDLTPYELGLFEPEKSIKVVLDSVGDKDISNFLETLTHEYIHYTSYVSEERTLPQFFEEGLTEFLARKVVNEQLHKDTNLGYPVIVKVINGMSKKISIQQFEDIYFNKSADQLESLLDSAYGKNFYKDTQLYFALIPYSPPDEALKFANNIMYKIGEPNLEEKDLYSN
jgi:hypothetical protein